MSNMSYCRFRNTADDMRDCLDAVRDRESINVDERRALRTLVKLSVELLEEMGFDMYDNDFDEKESVDRHCAELDAAKEQSNG